MQILFEDNHCLVVNKVAGLPTQAPSHVPDSEECYARGWLMKNKNRTEGRVYLGIPHRLDRPVSGVLLFAKSSKAAARLAEQFRTRQVEKTYWAIVPNAPQLPSKSLESTWIDHLEKVEGIARGRVVKVDSPGSKRAESRVQVLGHEPDWALLEVKPQTGRMHQIRLQCSHRELPVLGDLTYGSPFALAGVRGMPLIALHARKLVFLHPIRFEPVSIEAPVPFEWDRFPIGMGLRMALGLS